MTIGEWMEDRYFDGLLREADARALRNIFRASASRSGCAQHEQCGADFHHLLVL